MEGFLPMPWERAETGCTKNERTGSCWKARNVLANQLVKRQGKIKIKSNKKKKRNDILASLYRCLLIAPFRSNYVCHLKSSFIKRE